MRTSILSASLAVFVGVSALPQEMPSTKVVPALPVNMFADTPRVVVPVPFDQAVATFKQHNATTANPENNGNLRQSFTVLAAAATCSNPRIRVEWDSYPDSSKQAFIDGIKCLMGRGPSGQFPQSKSRYEDLVAVHQNLTPNIHNNAKFLLWHRYFTWVFEDMLSTECGFAGPIPWFDETRYAGRFAQSSVFSSRWFGGIALNGNCVRDGQFANLALNIGPGPNNQVHCLARAGDGSKTANCNQAYVNQCNAFGDYDGMRQCSEQGPHAWGHNGIGAVMQDVWASPSDPVFFLHHGFIDRNFRIWQNGNPGVRTTTINGNDINGNALTLDTTVSVSNLRPTVQIRDILDTTSTTMCYRYNY